MPLPLPRWGRGRASTAGIGPGEGGLKILLATTSKGKIREQLRALEGLPVDIVLLEDLEPVEPPEEHGATFAENAAAKALYYQRATGIPSLGEDSGLEVVALDGAPGLHSARWLGKDTPYHAKNRELLERLSGLEGDARAASFVSAVAIAEGGTLVFEAVKSCEGRISEEPQGSGGFGYDPVFVYLPRGKTLAQLSVEEKDRMSHRGKSMALVREYLLGSGVF